MCKKLTWWVRGNNDFKCSRCRNVANLAAKYNPDGAPEACSPSNLFFC